MHCRCRIHGVIMSYSYATQKQLLKSESEPFEKIIHKLFEVKNSTNIIRIAVIRKLFHVTKGKMVVQRQQFF